MTKKAQALLEEALKLSPDERRELARQIEESVDGPGDALALSPEWCAEIDRRLDRVLSGKAKGIPAAEALAEVRRSLEERPAARGKASPHRGRGSRRAQGKRALHRRSK
jgi:putative addiction module component (TIGR02574 family)